MTPPPRRSIAETVVSQFRIEVSDMGSIGVFRLPDPNFVPPEDPLLQLNTKRCGIIEGSCWVKDLYNSAVDWKKEMITLSGAVIALNDRLTNSKQEIVAKEREIKDLHCKISDLENPSREERLSNTHIMVENSFWRDQKNHMSSLENQQRKDRTLIKLGALGTSLSTVAYILHLLHFLP